ncbi:flavodoxin family protein [Alloscardovia theropitheci]|uniref:Flavodoxin family protein n=1 Tax=Alloscardovia theropitheci TaxID=2496842 RepID=A0A4R0QNX5_9BIFI|nr:NAD(P)H-dependent oxidoreductase [Alloscardovia theropitheci]TCD53903.1 flavodoxin family protein [Alloscardovia theropitheci]
MKITVIYTYPNDSGYNHAVLEAVQRGFANNTHNHDVTLLDLYKENFDPVLRFDENHRRRDLAQDPETARYRQLITDSDLLVFIFPIWWAGMPALLKGFIDRIFVSGFAYKYKGLLPQGLLKGKKAWLITTHDTPKLFVNLFQQDYEKVLQRQVLKQMSGITTIKHHQLSFMRKSSLEKRAKFLKKIEEFARSL